MVILLSVTALLIAALGGMGVVLLLQSSSSKADPFAVLGTSLLAGAGLVAIATFFLGFLAQGVALRVLVIALCLLLAILGLRRRGSAWGSLWPRLGVAALPGFLMVAHLTLVTWFSLYRSTLGWDGLFIWEWKARVAFLNGGVLPASLFRSGYDFFHLSYPPLVPLLEAWIYGFLGRMDQSAIKLIGPYFALAAGLLLLSAVRRECSTWWSGVVLAIPFLLVPALWFGEGGASSGYADFPLSAAYLGVVFYCVEYWRERSSETARMIGLTAMLLPFIKPDGIIPLLCAGACVAPLIAHYRSWRAAIVIAGPALVLLAIWKGFLAFAGAPHEPAFSPVTPAVFFAHLDRARSLGSWTFRELAAIERWSLLWPLTFAGLLIMMIRLPKAAWFPWAVTTILPLGLYPCVFFFSAWEPVEPHVVSSLPRLFGQVASAAALLTGVALAGLVDSLRTVDAGKQEQPAAAQFTMR